MTVASFVKFAADPDLSDYVLDNRPVVLWNKKASKAVWMNPAAALLFGVSSPIEGMRRRYKDQKFARPHLRRVATEGKPGAGGLSRLRFSFGLGTLALTCLCTPVEQKGKRHVLMVSLAPVAEIGDPAAATDLLLRQFGAESAAAVIGPEDDRWRGTPGLADFLNTDADTARLRTIASGNRFRHVVPGIGEGVSILQLNTTEGDQVTVLMVMDSDSAGDWTALPVRTVAQTTPRSGPTHATETASIEQIADNEQPATAVQAHLAAAPASVRFVWQSDWQHRLISVSDDLQEVVGTAAADILGQTWQQIVSAFPLDPSDTLLAALETGDTWSGLKVNWPMTDSDYRVPVSLSALATHDRDRNFAGYRGFGVISPATAFQTGLWFGTAPDQVEISTEAVPADTDVSDDSDAADGPADDGSATSGADLPAHTSEVPVDSPLIDDQVWSEDLASENSLLPAYEREDGSNVVGFQPAAGRDEPIDNDSPEQSALSPEDETTLRRIAQKLGGRVSDDAEEDRQGAEDDHAALEPAEDNQPLSAETDAEEAPSVIWDGQDDIPDDSASNIDQPAEPAEPEVGQGTVQPDWPARQQPIQASTALSIFRNLPSPALVFQHGHTLIANPSFLKLAGYDNASEFDDAGGLDTLFFEDDETNPAAIGTTSRSGVWITLADGQRLKVDAVLQSIRVDEEQVFALTMMEVRQPTEDMPSQPLAGDTELEDILNTATDGVLILNDAGELLGINASAEALFGVAESDVLGQSFVQLLAEESQADVTDYLDGLARNGVKSVLNDGREAIARESSGGLIPIFLTIGSVGSQETQKYCAVIRDITSWKRAEEELTAARRHAELANAQKSDFLAKVSHEIRTPLNGVIGFAEIMAEERFGPIENDRYKQYVADIKASGEHIMELVNDLLDLSKIEAGKLDLTFSAVNANEILAECVALLQPRANSDRVIIRSSLANNLPKIVADPKTLRQVVLNLLSNAVKFTMPGGQVIVSSMQNDQGEVVLRIRDTGVGMSEEDLNTALEPFRQLETARPAEAGTGLGLPLSKALVEANRATFDIESEINRGTMVKISFPVQRVLAE